jgi:CheY-like chemotaxis protein
MENMAASNSRPRLAGLKVLVIDDSKTIRRTAETLLAREGCEVFTAVDGFSALITATSALISATSHTSLFTFDSVSNCAVAI